MDFCVKLANIAMPIVIAIGFYFGWRQFDAIRKARMAELILTLYQMWDSPRLEKSRQKINEIGKAEKVKDAIIEADKQNSAELFLLVRVSNFFDTVGSLVSEGYLDKEIAYELMGSAFDNYNNLYSVFLKDPNYKDFLRCYQELDKIFRKVKADREKAKIRRT